MNGAYPDVSCVLCNELNGRQSLSKLLYPDCDPQDRVLTESDNFVVIYDISPVVPGHALLLSREHFKSIANVPSEWIPELNDVRREAVRRISRKYQRPFLFEHGSPTGGPSSGVCVQHAHIHLIPAAIPVRESLSEFGPVCELGDMKAALEVVQRFERDYLYFQDISSPNSVICLLETPPRPQFIRQIVAEHLGIPHWNWKSSLCRSSIPSEAQAPTAMS